MASSTIEEAIRYKLVNTATVTTEVSTRIFWLEAIPNTTYPYLTYFTVDDPHDAWTLDKLDAGQVRIQVNVYDDNRFEALRISNVVREALDRYQGTVDSKVIERITCSGTITVKEADNRIFNATFDAMVHYYD